MGPPGVCLGRAEDTGTIVRSLRATTHPIAVLVQGGPGIGLPDRAAGVR